jgi:hypothetical protein
MNPTPFQIAAGAVFALALAHVFLSARIEKLAHRFPAHAGTLHLLGEVEVVFGFWAMVLFGVQCALEGTSRAIEAVESLDFREPLFVFVAMVVAGSRPVLQAASALVDLLVRLIPLPRTPSYAFVALGFTPLLGSFITEPAAMTIAALLVRQTLFVDGASSRLRYAAIAVLFVNVSIGGVLTNYAAPPVLMVAERWGWDTAHMAFTFGGRAVGAVFVNAALFVALFWKPLAALHAAKPDRAAPVSKGFVAIHLAMLALVVLASHHTVLFLGIFLLFLGLAQAYRHHHSPLLLREGLLVGFFLSGLVVLGSPQGWWLGPLVAGLGDHVLFLGTAALTAVIDNAALTYLGALLPDTTDSFKYFLLAGAVAGGGLTVIANAPNPAGASLLKERLPGGILENGRLFLYALPPTAVALLAFALP